MSRRYWLTHFFVAALLPACAARRADERPIVNFWPIAHCTAPVEGEGYHLTALGSLFTASKDETGSDVRFGPLFQSSSRDGGSSSTIGPAPLAVIWNAKSNEIEGKWMVLGVFDLLALAKGTSSNVVDERGRTTESRLSVLSLFNTSPTFAPIGLFRTTTTESDDIESDQQWATHTLFLFDGDLFELFGSARWPTTELVSVTETVTNEEGVTEDVTRNVSRFAGHETDRKVLSLFDGDLFALERSQSGSHGSFDWAFLSFFDSFQLARSKGREDDAGNVVERNLTVLGPLFQRIDSEDRSVTSLAFLFGYERGPEGSTLRLFHLLPIRF